MAGLNRNLNVLTVNAHRIGRREKVLEEGGRIFPAILIYMDCCISDLCCLHNISKTNLLGIFSLVDYF